MIEGEVVLNSLIVVCLMFYSEFMLVLVVVVVCVGVCLVGVWLRIFCGFGELLVLELRC